jgi:hypothetical protein
MRRFVPAVLVLAAVAGCAGDPENEVLASGSQAVVAEKFGASLKGEAFLGDYRNRPTTHLEPGVRVTLGYDPGFYLRTQEELDEAVRRARDFGDDGAYKRAVEFQKAGPQKYEQGSPDARLRMVKVTVESGPYEGRSGEVRRDALRPIK